MTDLETTVQITLRGPLAWALIQAAERNGEEPVSLLSRSVDRMIEQSALDTIENSQPPRLLDIADFWIAAAAMQSPKDIC